MKKVLSSTFIWIAALALLSVSVAQAALVDNGGGLIYDTDINLTWYHNTNDGLYWEEAMAATAALTVGGTTAGSWRLPLTPGLFEGPTTEGEMGHLYTELQAYPALFAELTKIVGNIDAVQATYWYGNDNYFGDYSQTFYYTLATRDQEPEDKTEFHLYSMPVHEGNVGAPVPIPGAFLLLGSGLAGLGFVRKRICSV